MQIFGCARSRVSLGSLLSAVALAGCGDGAAPLDVGSEQSSAHGVQATLPTYKGARDNSGTNCSAADFSMIGYRPFNPALPNARYPLFLHFVGTKFMNPDEGGDYDGSGGRTIAQAMAHSGFFAVSVQYDNTGLFNIENKTRCMFDKANTSGLIARLCQPNAASDTRFINCDAGIATSGHSQGATVALGAGNYEPRVRATWALGHPGDGFRWHLAYNRVRFVNGTNDPLANDRNKLNQSTGQNCSGSANRCLRADNSGWMLVQQNELTAPNEAGHCWFNKLRCGDAFETLDPKFHPNATQEFSLAKTATWLATAAASTRVCPSNRITLRGSNNKFVSARVTDAGVPVRAAVDLAFPWEVFKCLELGSGRVALQADNHQYVSTDVLQGSRLYANRTQIGQWESFDYVNLGGGAGALRARANNLYVTVDVNQSGQLVASQSSTTPAGTRFVVAPAP